MFYSRKYNNDNDNRQDLHKNNKNQDTVTTGNVHKSMIPVCTALC